MDDESSSFEHRLVAMEPGSNFKSRYDVQEELGKGRFGVVHKVVDKSTNQKLAAKFIRCRTQKDKDKVQEEINIMNLLRHQKLLQLAAAFEHPKEMIMVMEYISGGELFERVVADDFTLTEKDCILFMRQICEGVAYMHSQSIVHLDLKPENIMCHTRTSHEIKIIDFGLAQKLNPDVPVRVLFGTPEFIPPEIINYEPIGVESDMWSLGVICYVLLSGLSPFMGDTDSETFANITRADYDFDDEAFNTVSQDARDFIGALLVKRKDDRISADQCLRHVWLDPENHQETVVLSTDKLKKFIIRRKWQKTGNAIRALGRMATLSASRRNSANSNPTTPRTSISGGLVPRMSSLEEERLLKKIENHNFESIIKDSFDENDESSHRETVDEISEDNQSSEGSKNVEEANGDISLIEKEDVLIEDEKRMLVIEETSSPKDNSYSDGNKLITKLNKMKLEESDDLYRTKKEVKARACSERSDSGISDCSVHLTSSSSTSTPLLGKKFPINEEGELRDSFEEDIDNGSKYVSSVSISLKNGAGKKVNGILLDGLEKKEGLKIQDGTNGDSVKSSGKLGNKLESFNGAVGKGKPQPASESLKRLPIYTSRTVANTIKKFDHQITKTSPPPEESSSPIILVTHSPQLYRKSSNIKTLPPKSPVLSRIGQDPARIPRTTSRPPKITINEEPTKTRQSKIDRLVQKLENKTQIDDGGELFKTGKPTVRYRSPSPSLLRKTQAVINKEQANELYRNKHQLETPKNGSPDSPKSPKLNRSRNDSFRRAAAFWNNPKT